MFALTHHATIHEAGRRIKMNLKETLENYCLLGDDVVILNQHLYREYRLILKGLQVPISETKSLEDVRVAEFAGKVITPDAFYALPKYRSMSDNSFVDILRQFGPAAIALCRPRQREVLSWLAPLPVELEGLGWNPKGLPLEVRMEKAQAWIHRVSQETRFFEDPVTRLKRETERMFYMSGPSTLVYDTPWSPLADPRPGTVKERVLASTKVTKELVDDLLDEPVLNWLPSVSKPSWVTTLEVLEKYNPDNTKTVSKEKVRSGPRPSPGR